MYSYIYYDLNNKIKCVIYICKVVDFLALFLYNSRIES